jgi:D-aminoacyl-tRNA deacylase
MRAVLQRVARASVSVEGRVKASIGPGLLVFLGIGQDDTEADLDWLVRKIPRIRCFEDEAGRMNRDLRALDGEVLVISQFTLFGNLRKGTRPSFNRAALPDAAVPLYETFVARLEAETGKPVGTGAFGEHMVIEAVNDGPVTLVLDTRQKDF